MNHWTGPKVVLLLLTLAGAIASAEEAASGAVLFGEGVISTPENETAITFTPDGKSAYFAIATAQNSFSAILVSHFANDKWSTPEMASFSGQYKDQEPTISPDGSRLYFASSRPRNDTARRDMDIWVVERTQTGWSEPRNLGAPINTEAAETHPSVTRDGSLLFSSTRAGGKGGADIHVSRVVGASYAQPENLGDGVNSQEDDWMGCVAPDESFLVLSRRSGSQGVNLLLARKEKGIWQSAVDLGPGINTPAQETTPSLSPDGKRLFFVSNRHPEGPPQVRTQRITRAELEAELKRQSGNVLNDGGNIYWVEMAAVLGVIDKADQAQAEGAK